MVDLSEGIALKYVPIPGVNRVKCAKLDAEDIATEVTYLQNVVVCCVLGAHRPFEIIEGHIKHIWKDFPIDKVILIRKGLCLVRFVEYKDAIQFPDLDIKYWGLQSRSKLGSMRGIPLRTDRYTKDKSMLRYARSLIEMQIDGDFAEYMEFANENGVLIRQQVKHDWLPLKCSHYRMFGYTQEHCRKKENQRKEWRVRVQPQPQELEHPK
ncbi:hypothetical protein Cgig2_026448 [Carnegiea gigantea]|uniref:DUF4283 domain-containing protein n=1 Tax=Carnegiea gigantea TaxID=171969 RepID=A0A9Q1GK34_9CARY|nr:hypothetical protein Cgig2_026448 [Carnegiea gigantea]